MLRATKEECRTPDGEEKGGTSYCTRRREKRGEGDFRTVTNFGVRSVQRGKRKKTERKKESA